MRTDENPAEAFERSFKAAGRSLVVMSDGTISGPAKSKVLSQPDKQDLRCCEEIGCIKFLLLY